MTKNKISDLLDELQSKETYIRSDALKKIIKGKINDEDIIHALNNVIENDPSMALRNFARSALDGFGVEHSAVEETVVINEKSFDHNTHNTSPDTHNASPVLPFWSNRKQKSWSIWGMIVAVFILTLPYSILSIFLYPLLNFPVGLVGLVSLVNNKVDYEAIYWNHSGIPVALVWIFYIRMATAIVRSNNRKVVVCLYIILILLLILNVAGCQIIGPVIMSGVS
jgi:hypothetical protein